MAAHQLQYLCVANEGAHRRASDFPSYFILMSSRTPPPHAAPAHAEKQRQHTSLCYMSRGGWPPFRPPTHFVQHSSGGGPPETRGGPSPPTQPGLISGANRSTGLQKPAQRRTSTLAHAPTPHARRRHQHSRGMQRPAASRSRRPHFRVRKNAAVGQLRGFTSSPDGRCAQQGGTREATRKEKERVRGKQRAQQQRTVHQYRRSNHGDAS